MQRFASTYISTHYIANFNLITYMSNEYSCELPQNKKRQPSQAVAFCFS